MNDTKRVVKLAQIVGILGPLRDLVNKKWRHTQMTLRQATDHVKRHAGNTLYGEGRNKLLLDLTRIQQDNSDPEERIGKLNARVLLIDSLNVKVGFKNQRIEKGFLVADLEFIGTKVPENFDEIDHLRMRGITSDADHYGQKHLVEVITWDYNED